MKIPKNEHHSDLKILKDKERMDLKILIGTPIHQIKDYCMERWLQNVSKLQNVSPAHLLLVDNSPDLSYVEKVKGYCKKFGITDFEIVHIDVHQENGIDERIGRSREVIRQYILKNDYDVWFSWESDQIIPTDTLNILIKVMRAGNYSMIHPNAWSRENPSEPEANFGVCLINRDVLEKYGFLLVYPDMPDCWHGGEVWFKKQVIKGGGSFIEIYGIITPILHLNSPT